MKIKTILLIASLAFGIQAHAQMPTASNQDLSVTFKGAKDEVVLVAKGLNDVTVLDVTITNKASAAIEIVGIGANPAIVTPTHKSLKPGESTSAQMLMNLKVIHMPSMAQVTVLYRKDGVLIPFGQTIQIAAEGTAVFAPLHAQWSPADSTAGITRIIRPVSIPAGISVADAVVDAPFTMKRLDNDAFEIGVKATPDKPTRGALRIKLSDGKQVTIMLMLAPTLPPQMMPRPAQSTPTPMPSKKP